jgi:hypothetical protein
MWWPGNEKLKAKQVTPTEWSNFQQGVVIEGHLEFNENNECIELIIEVDDSRFIILLSAHGKMTVFTCDPENNTMTELQKADRQLDTIEKGEVTVLARCGMLEVYLDGNFIECCTLGCPDADHIRCLAPETRNGHPGEILQTWLMDIHND